MQLNTKPLELTVSNFGPIAEANIELRPMSVFVGPSNTGKSYMAVLIYSLHKFFSAYSYRRYTRLNLSRKNVVTTLAWARETHSNLQRAKREQSSLIELSESIETLVRSFLPRIVKDSGDVLESELVRCFGVDKSKDLIRHSSDSHTLLSLWSKCPRTALHRHVRNLRPPPLAGALGQRSQSQTPPPTPHVLRPSRILGNIHRKRRGDSRVGGRDHPRLATRNQPQLTVAEIASVEWL